MTRFGRLTIVENVSTSSGKRGMVRCLCDCGAETVASFWNLKYGNTKSCGCLKREFQARGGDPARKSGAYKSWARMRDRTSANSSDPHKKKYYVDRGITCCQEWESFERFFADMGERPPGMTLDRVDPSLGYSKENCRWATKIEQARNRTNTRKYPFSGSELTAAEICERTGVNYRTFLSRVSAGWQVEAAATTAPKRMAAGDDPRQG